MMELIRKQADLFIRTELGKMEHTDTYHVVVAALKREMSNYYKQADKVTFLEQSMIRISEAKQDHLQRCTNPLVCREIQDYDSMIFFAKQELDKNGVVDTDVFSKSDIDKLNNKLDQVLKEIETLKTGHQIIYDDVIGELEALRKLFYLDKKTWRQVFLGKLFEMTAGGIVSDTLSKKIIEIFSDILSEDQIKQLMN